MKFTNQNSIFSQQLIKQTLMPRALLIISVLLWHSSSQADDLLGIYQIAKQNDAVFAAAQSTWAATQEKQSQASARLLPNIELTASGSYNISDINIQGTSPFPEGKKEYHDNSYDVTLRQPVYRKQDWVQYDQSKLQLQQADVQLRLAKQNLILRVTQAYFDVLAAQDNLLFVGSQNQAIDRQLVQAKRKFEVGTNTSTDVHEAQARFDLVLSQEIAAKNNLLIANRALSKIIGTTAPPLEKLSYQWKPSRPVPEDEKLWLERAVESNPDVIIQTAALQIAEKEIVRQRAGHFPTLDLVANYNEDSADGSATFGAPVDTTSKSIALQLTVPLYSGGGTSSLKREAVHLKEASRYGLIDAVRNAEFDSSQAYIGVINGIAQVNALDQAVVSNENLLKSSERGLEVGIRTIIDTLNAQEQLYSAKRDLQQARYNTLLSGLQLSATVGQLTEENLLQINGWLKN